MARILIKVTDATAKDARRNLLLYKRGDIVKVTEDGYYFGDKIEGNKNPKFVIVDVVGGQASEVSLLVEAVNVDGDVDSVTMLKRRKRKFNFNNTTVAETIELDTNKHATMTQIRLNQLIEVKV